MSRNVQPHELICKKAIRTKSVDLATGYRDFSFTTRPITILAVTENHIVYESCMGNKSILDSRWIDDHWTGYDDLMELAKEGGENGGRMGQADTTDD